MDTTTIAEKVSLSLEEAALYLGIGRATLYRLMDSGVIQSFHVGRRRLLRRQELDRFIQAQVEAENGRDS